ncbi:hypothetical protein LPJ75_004743, partial [Coemansia sp. RSA 2598]
MSFTKETKQTGESRPKLTLEQQKTADILKYADDIYYSDRYDDDEHEYRHVSLPEG